MVNGITMKVGSGIDMKKLPKEYLDDILVRLAHHSSAIEGNTISLAETISIILHNKVISDRTLDLREIYEVKNHEQAFGFVLSELENNEPLSIYNIKEIHALLTDRLQYDKGQFKTSDNAIKGADFLTASPKETPLFMQQWVENLNFRLASTTDEQKKIEIISESHIAFERIHPFSDGNGRTGRMLINYSLLQNDLAPLVIDSKDKAEYIAYLSEQNIKNLSAFIEKNIRLEQDRIERFRNSEKQIIQEDELELE